MNKQMFWHSLKFGVIMTTIIFALLYALVQLAPAAPEPKKTLSYTDISLNLAYLALFTGAMHAVGWSFAKWSWQEMRKYAPFVETLLFTTFVSLLFFLTYALGAENNGMLIGAAIITAFNGVLVAIPFFCGYRKFRKVFLQRWPL
ncbi:MAG: hypothetical protein K2W82_16710 [Candidatus Obscuribacterales bacterium]|nr:hypothetical protein [Candidatus Obscuribacterales bacterium]